MTQFTAQQAIDQIKSVRTTCFGVDAQKYNYAVDVREQLQIMCEAGKLSPAEYYKALKITWPIMSQSERDAELYYLSN